MQGENRFLNFAEQVIARHQGLGLAFEPAAMMHLEEQPQEIQEPFVTQQNYTTNLYHIHNLKEENYLVNQNLSFLTQVLEQKIYQNLYPSVEKQIEKVIREEMPKAQSSVIHSVSQQMYQLVLQGGMEQLELIREKLISESTVKEKNILKEQEILFRKIENIWNSSIYHIKEKDVIPKRKIHTQKEQLITEKRELLERETITELDKLTEADRMTTVLKHTLRLVEVQREHLLKQNQLLERERLLERNQLLKQERLMEREQLLEQNQVLEHQQFSEQQLLVKEKSFIKEQQMKPAFFPGEHLIETSSPEKIFRETDSNVSMEYLQENPEVQERIQEEISKEIQKETQKDISKEVQKETQKDISKEIQKETQKEVSKEIRKETQKEVKKEITKEILHEIRNENAEVFHEETNKILRKQEWPESRFETKESEKRILEPKFFHESIHLEYPTEETDHFHQKVVEILRSELAEPPKIPKILQETERIEQKTQTQTQIQMQMQEKTRTISETILSKMERTGIIPSAMVHPAERTIVLNQLSHAIMEYAQSESEPEVLQEQVTKLLESHQRSLIYGNMLAAAEPKISVSKILHKQISVNQPSKVHAEPVLKMEAVPFVYRSEETAVPEQGEKTKHLEKQVREVVKTLKNVEETTIIQKEQNIKQQRQVVHEVLKSNPGILIEGAGAGFLRQEVRQSVEEQMDQNVNRIVNQVYRRLEERLKSERGRRGLI